MHESKKNKEFLTKLINYIKRKNNVIPIGALITKYNKIISIATNSNQYGINHAECQAIYNAQKNLQSMSLDECTLYTTLEPCIMCVGAAINANIKLIYFGCTSEKSGIQTYFNIYNLEIIKIININCYQNEIKSIIQSFFNEKRKNKKKKINKKIRAL